MEIKHDLYLGDCEDVLKIIPDNSVDLIFTSPPYADQRKKTYGGIHPDDYVEWFLPKTEQMLRVLKPTGTFVLNIKEKVVDSERSTYVMELILAMRKQGWLSAPLCNGANLTVSNGGRHEHAQRGFCR